MSKEVVNIRVKKDDVLEMDSEIRFPVGKRQVSSKVKVRSVDDQGGLIEISYAKERKKGRVSVSGKMGVRGYLEGEGVAVIPTEFHFEKHFGITEVVRISHVETSDVDPESEWGHGYI